MAPLLLLLLILAMAGGSDGAWCVCRSDMSTPALQKTLDYACGAGADCNPIHQNGACYNPNTVLAHCSYAANSYYQRNNQNPQACDFTGTAQLVPSDPSQPGCTYPATPSAAGSSGTPSSSNTPTTPGVSPLTPGTGTSTGGGFTPNSPTTTGTGVGGAFGTLGPSGAGGFDGSGATKMLVIASSSSSSLLLAVMVSALAFIA